MPTFVGRLSTEKKHQYLRLSLRHERLPKISINARIFQSFRNRNHYLLLCAARECNNVICYLCYKDVNMEKNVSVYS